jgi:hypothetical protein
VSREAVNLLDGGVTVLKIYVLLEGFLKKSCCFRCGVVCA